MISVATGTVMRGDMVATGTVRIDGRVDGRIVCSRLEIGSDGYVHGSVAARDLIVAGQIVGQAAACSVTLMDGAFIEGEIHYASISLAAGATMTGKAVRAGANYVPPDLAQLEQDVSAVDAQLDAMETVALDRMAEQANAEYPRYQQLRASLVASR